MNKKLTVALFITNLLALAALFYVWQSNNAKGVGTSDPVTAIQVVSKAPKLPVNAVKISECVPFEGAHYVEPDKTESGPIYSAYKGKVTSIEYMFKPSAIPGEKGAKLTPAEAEKLIKQHKLTLADLVTANVFEFDLYDYPYHKFQMNWSDPHPGLPEPHYDVHFFLIDKEERATICPDAKLESVYSEEVMENINKYKIPFPGLNH